MKRLGIIITVLMWLSVLCSGYEIPFYAYKIPIYKGKEVISNEELIENIKAEKSDGNFDTVYRSLEKMAEKGKSKVEIKEAEERMKKKLYFDKLYSEVNKKDDNFVIRISMHGENGSIDVGDGYIEIKEKELSIDGYSLDTIVVMQFVGFNQELKKEEWIAKEIIFYNTENSEVNILYRRNIYDLYFADKDRFEIINTKEENGKYVFRINVGYEKYIKSIVKKDNSVEYDDIKEMNSKYNVVKRKYKLGLVDKNNKMVKKCIYEKIDYKSYEGKDYYLFRTADKLIITNEKFEEIGSKEEKYTKMSEARIEKIENLNLNLFVMEINDNYNSEQLIIRKDTEELVLSVKGAFKDEYESNIVIIGNDDKYGLIDENGQIKIEPKYKFLNSPNKGYVMFSVEENKFGIMDINENIIVEPKYDFVNYPDKGIIIVKENEKWGILNDLGKELVKPKYEQMGWISEGFITVKKNGKFGYIDKTGKILIQFKYDEAAEFVDGKARVMLAGKWFYIDKNGNKIKG